MLSSRIKSDSSDNEGESSMPGDYAPIRNTAAPTAPPSTASPSRPMLPPTSRARPGSPAVPPPNRPRRRRQSAQRVVSPVRRRRRRSHQRPLTPDVVIHRRRRHRSSSGRQRVMRISLDNRPTLGLRGPPTRVLELERVRCRRRRRRHHRSCDDAEHHAPPPPPQSNFIVANVIPNPCLPPNQAMPMAPSNSRTALSGSLSNLTPAMIENLPKHTIHLPAIHLPGSQANTNTELHTIILPAELINPVDGTLSVIQANPAVIGSGSAMPASPPIMVPAQPQMIRVPSNGTPLQNYLATASGPFLQQLQDLVHRVTLSQAQPAPPSSSFVAPPSNAAANLFPNAPPVSPNDTMNIGPYASANIRPTNSFINPSVFRATNPRNVTPYRFPNRTSFQSPTSTPVRPADIAPYRTTNMTSFQPRRTTPTANDDIGPYRPANITPFSSPSNLSMGSSTLASSSRARTTPYIPPSSQGSSGAVSSYSNSLDNGSINVSTPPQSQTPYRSNNPAPRSILRNGPSNAQMNTTYTRLNPASVSSTCAIVRKRTTFA